MVADRRGRQHDAMDSLSDEPPDLQALQLAYSRLVDALCRLAERAPADADAASVAADDCIRSVEALRAWSAPVVRVILMKGRVWIGGQAVWMESSLRTRAEALGRRLADHGAVGLEFGPETDAPGLAAIIGAAAEGSALPTPEGAPRLMEPTASPMDLGHGVRGVSALWAYGRAVAGLSHLQARPPVQTHRARRLVKSLMEATEEEGDFLLGLPQTGSGPVSRARRAVDVSVVMLALARGLALSRDHMMTLGLVGLLHNIGESLVVESAGLPRMELAHSVALRQVMDERQLTPSLLRRTAVAVEHALGPRGLGPPHLKDPPPPLLESQAVALACTWLDLLQGTEHSHAVTPFEAMETLLTGAPGHLDSRLVHLFVATVGHLPVGTVVRLQEGSPGVVTVARRASGQGPPVLRPWRIEVAIFEPDGDPDRPKTAILGRPASDGGRWQVERVFSGPRTLRARALFGQPQALLAGLGLGPSPEGLESP